MRDGHRVIPQGMSIAQHEQMAATIDQLQQQLTSLRDTLRESFGSASDPYQALQRMSYNLKALKGALESELIEQHTDMAPKMLRGIYHQEEV